MNLHPAKHRAPANICTILDQRRRRWADAVQMPYQCAVPAGIGQKLSDCRYIIRYRPTFCDAGPASKRHRAQRLAFAEKRSSSKSNNNAEAMQARRLRRRARIKPTMAQRLALAGCRCCPTPTNYGGPLSCWHAGQAPYISCQIHIFSPPLQQTQTPNKCPFDAGPTSKQRRLSVTCLLGC